MPTDDPLDPRNTTPGAGQGPIGFLRPPGAQAAPPTPQDFLDPRSVAPHGLPQQGPSGELPNSLIPSWGTLASTIGAGVGGPLLGTAAKLGGAEVGPGMAELIAASRAAGSSSPRLAAALQAAKGALTSPITWARAGGAGVGAATGSAITGESPQEQLGRFTGGAIGEGAAKVVGEPLLGAASDLLAGVPALRKLSGAPFAAGISDTERTAAQYAASITQPSDVWKLTPTERVLGGPTLTPSQIHPESSVLGMVEGMAEKSFFGAPVLAANRLRMGEAVSANVGKLVGGLSNNGTDKQVVAGMLTDAATGAKKIYGKYASWVWENAIAAADDNGALVPTREFASRAAQLYNEIPKGMEGLDQGYTAQLRKFATTIPMQYTFRDAQKARSMLLEAERAPGGRPEYGVLAEVLRNSMNDAADAAGPGIKQAWEGARQFTAKGAETYSGKFMEAALDHADEKTIVDGLFNGTASGMAKARSIVGQDRWDGAVGWKLRDLIDIDPDTQRPNWTRTQRNLLSWGADGKLEEAIPGAAARQNLITAVNVGARSEHTAKMPMGSMAWGFLQSATALASIGLRAARGPGAAILLTPAAVAKAMTNPSIARWLTIGTNAAPGTFTAMRATSGLISQLTVQGYFARGDATFQGDPQQMRDLQDPSARQGPDLSTIQQHDAINKQQQP